ncbi:hypothetical protein pb186bvf_007959 [Paramecium bursaria]
MITFFVNFIIACQAQIQVNPISGEQFFYGGRSLNQFGQGLNISQPDLGFQVQGGLIQGPLSTKINILSIISVSQLEQFNILAALELKNSQYQIQLIKYLYNGTINVESILFNISSNNIVCQQIKIIDYIIIIVHCINTTNNNVILYNYNQSQILVTQTTTNINYTQLVSVQIQDFYYQDVYELYFAYILQFQSTIYNTYLYNNTYNQLVQVWSYNTQFMQMFITEFQEIFALQYNYLLYVNSSYSTKYLSQNHSNWLNMLVLSFDGESIIYLINNYTLSILNFNQQFNLIEQAQLPFAISNGKLYSNIAYTYVITSQCVLTYAYDQEFSLYQYNQNVLPNTTLFNIQQNILININMNGIQLYQTLDYYIYNTKPSQSGNITLNYYDQLTQQLTGSFFIYVNLLSSFNNQICPTTYNFNGVQEIINGSNYIIGKLSQLEGYNMSYFISTQDFNGQYQLVQQANIFNNSDATILGLYSLSAYNSLLIVFQDGTKIVFQVQQLDTQSHIYDSIAQYSLTLSEDLIDTFEFIEYPNGTILVLAFQSTTIVVFQYQLFYTATQIYSINMTDYMTTKTIDVDHYFTIGTTSFFVNVFDFFIIDFGLNDYTILYYGDFSFNYVSNSKFNQNFVFATIFNNVTTYLWKNNQLIYLSNWTVPGVSSTEANLYVFPLENGTYVIYGSDKDMDMVFYDKSMFKTANIGKVFNVSINVTGYTFSFENWNYAYSSNFFYAAVQYNGSYYLNVYQCTQSAINALYKSIWLESNPTQISVTTNTLLEVDYVALDIKQNYIIYEIPHNTQVILFPQFQLVPQYNFTNQILVNNTNSQTSFNIQFDVDQSFLTISTTYLSLANISNNLTNSVLVIQPTNYFTGVIQNYSVQCQQCQEISMNQLISQQYLAYNLGTTFSQSYIQNGTQYLFISSDKTIIQFTYNNSTSPNLTNYNSSGQTLISYPPTGSSYIKTAAYINSILNGTNQTIGIFLSNITTDIQFACYSEGILQITTLDYYYSYYYAIKNRSASLVTIIENLQITPSAYLQITPVVTYYNDTNVIYGIFYQTVAYTLKLLLLEISLINNPITSSYSEINFLEFLQFQQLFPIQSIQQVGYPIIDNYFQTITVIYTTSVESGTLNLVFDGLQLIEYYRLCSFQLLNSTFQQQFSNMFDFNGNQLAILNIQQSKGQYQLILSLYDVNYQNCQQDQIIMPYQYTLLEANSYIFPQIDYLNENQLLISYDDMTFLYEVNQQLEISYITNTNSTITLNAYNSISSANQTINVYFTPYINNTVNNNTNNTDNNNTNTNNTDNNNTNSNTTDNYYYYYVLLSEGTNQINQFLPNVTSFFFSSRVSAVTEPTLLANLPPSLCSSHGSASYFINSVFAERTPISILTFFKLALILLSSLEFCYHQYKTHSSKSSQEACRETKGIRLHQSHPTGFGVKFKGHSWMSPSSEIPILTDFSP